MASTAFVAVSTAAAVAVCPPVESHSPSERPSSIASFADASAAASSAAVACADDAASGDIGPGVPAAQSRGFDGVATADSSAASIEGNAVVPAAAVVAAAVAAAAVADASAALSAAAVASAALAATAWDCAISAPARSRATENFSFAAASAAGVEEIGDERKGLEVGAW